MMFILGLFTGIVIMSLIQINRINKYEKLIKEIQEYFEENSTHIPRID